MLSSKMPFNEELKRLRVATGLSQHDAAAELKRRGISISARSLGDYERGQYEPDVIKQENLLRELGKIVGNDSDDIHSNATRRPALTIGPADDPWIAFYPAVIDGKWALLGQVVRTLNMPLGSSEFNIDVTGEGEAELEFPDPDPIRDTTPVEKSV